MKTIYVNNNLAPRSASDHINNNFASRSASDHTNNNLAPRSESDHISVGAKSQILSSVAPPRKKNLVTIFSQGQVLGPWKPMFY